jgi:predicted  nucleic acid-binding Zn-ribbon protein
MQDWAKALVDLQEFDIRAARIEQELSGIPAKQAELENLFSSEQKALDEAQSALKAIELNIRSLENEINVNLEKKRTFQSKTILIKNNEEYKAAMLQIEMCDKVISDLEDKQLEAMEAAEKAKAEVAAMKKTRDNARRRADGVNAELQELKANCEAMLAEMKPEREALVKRVEPELLVQYERQRSSRNASRTAPCVVPVMDGKCGRCRMRLTPQHCQNAFAGRKVNCPICGAILYQE